MRYSTMVSIATGLMMLMGWGLGVSAFEVGEVWMLVLAGVYILMVMVMVGKMVSFIDCAEDGADKTAMDGGPEKVLDISKMGGKLPELAPELESLDDKDLAWLMTKCAAMIGDEMPGLALLLVEARNRFYSYSGKDESFR